jgi:hypothetical protein
MTLADSPHRDKGMLMCPRLLKLLGFGESNSGSPTLRNLEYSQILSLMSLVLLVNPHDDSCRSCF